ncbi:MAG: hypothetical protein PHU43_10770, partial [Candidatus Bipolaricaulis sp.]|nr:hypothetical protein [Candidatus Bipolaricaulis sp.]
MAQVMGLKEAERRAFRLSHNDGLWDVLLGCFFLMFVGAPYLSSYLGDFWSSAVFLPFWGLVFAGLVAIRRRVVIPRVGVARFGEHRKAKLRVFSLAMLVVNAALLILGLLAATGVLKIGSPVVPLVLGLVLLAGFSVA